ncbi:FKBP-type peptidyl-prolyl cis-trans isomerase [Helicobacter winghamensis]|uniref:Peptidyl-prolyl cis-trans isomerase n=1 Tax=Helicobacter winghamensis TaxID=157268 RepID=A0A2N3PL39_9HELI|nr:peptidylprolyl isomerase [Helicobacter winghamensis]EEO26633.1 peptidyl-prolyl cis-trans isomerase, FKBP-type [Helicobacter winghamensis ATCC BAA-430]PKT79237.1 peptidylprolyl isomerase [Helicobacter winghamensis]PKT79317.1 peptidylprolyl isomerase [Helicobacter winghamensis]PKT79441.1 peptidylprolyl isomerase [Helicobacter winghamensis]PKT82408.1 peptidylprolyl isomerase [Helicobacter winghamensis]
MIDKNQVVSIEYSVKEEGANDVLDSNIGGKPLEFIMGAGEIIKGLEEAVAEMKVGDKKEVIIAPINAYGEYQSDYVQEVPRDQFVGIDLQQGMTLFGQGENGETVQVIVKDFNDEMVIVDYNHPLAGKTLNFSVTILATREATEKELSCGLHYQEHNHGGGCCGGGCGCH